MERGAGGAYTGSHASYVALSSITVLALALLSSVWTSDVSGTVGIIGLISVYLGSQEVLMLFLVFAPASTIIDIVRLAAVPHSVHGRGWLVLLTLLEMAAKIAGAVSAWSLHSSVAAGELMASYSAPLPSQSAPPPPPPRLASYERVQDPFAAAYSPPRSDASPLPPMGSHNAALGAAAVPRGGAAAPPVAGGQQLQAAAAAAPPAAPHHDLV